MRDPKRIKRILKKLEIAWTQNPDLRLGQFIYNLSGDGEVFYFEDSFLEERLDFWFFDKEKEEKNGK